MDPFELEKWFTRIWLLLSSVSGFAWAIIDKKGSKLSDIETRLHSMLQFVLGADVENTGGNPIVDDAAYVKHVSDQQAQGWETARHDAVNAFTLQTMATNKNERGDMQALNWMG